MNDAKYLEFLLGGETPLLDVLLESTDRILGTSHPLHFLAGTVSGSRVGHPMTQKTSLSQDELNRTHLNSRVTTITVSNELEKEGTLLVVDGPFSCVFNGLLGCDDVHSVHLRPESG